MANNFGPITTNYGGNFGGSCYFEFVPKEWLATEIAVNLVTQAVNTPVQLIPGKSWLRADCLDDSIDYNETDRTDKGGISYTAELSATVLKQQLGTQINLKKMRYHEFVVICHDRNKQARIIGNKAKGMTVAVNTASGKQPKDASLYQLMLQHQMPDPAPYYQPTV